MSSILLSGCTHLQTEEVLKNPSQYVAQHEIISVPFFAQQQYQCGPASLAMMLQAQNINVEPEALTPKMYIPQREGSLQIELLATARQHGVIPYVIDNNMTGLLAQIQADNPVLVLQNLGLAWLPKWHYAVVIGYDFAHAELILRSGIEQRHVLPMKVFERTWARSNYWGVVILPPDRMPAQVDEMRYIEAVAAVERSNQYVTSRLAYQTALQHWPENLVALMGLGNSYAAQQDYQNAVITFTAATQHHPNAADAYNNLADSLLNLTQHNAALQAIKKAIALGGRHKEVYLETLHAIEQKILLQQKQ